MGKDPQTAVVLSDHSTGDDSLVVLRLLSAVEENSTITQRSLAKELGVALGLAHAYLKRCVKKGYVKITQAPSNRYAYYLTPHGFAEKGRLTADYLQQSFRLFRLAKSQCSELIAQCSARGWHRLALAGTGEIAEIAVLSAVGSDVAFVAAIDPDWSGGNFLEIPVVADYVSLPSAVDAVILVTSRVVPKAILPLAMAVPSGRLLSPPFLKLEAVLHGLHEQAVTGVSSFASGEFHPERGTTTVPPLRTGL